MSMDDQYREMERFFQELRSFNDYLRTSFSDLNNNHEAVNPLWQDEFRKQYDSIWNGFVESMAHYVNRDAPKYEQFLDDQLLLLRHYLRG